MIERFYIENDDGLNPHAPGPWRVISESDRLTMLRHRTTARPHYIAIAFNKDMAARICRLLNEDSAKGAYAQAMETKIKDMADGMAFHISLLPKHLQQPLIDYLATGKWLGPKEGE
jgi:hypothetical protein